MSLSGSVSYNETAGTIIRMAFIMANLYGPNEVIDGNDQWMAFQLLNMIIKNWEADNCDLWAYQEATLFLTSGQSIYRLGSTAKAANDIVNTDNVVITTTSAVSTSGTNTITCTTVTGMTVGDNIGVINANSSTEWFTISSINTGTKVVTLNGNLSANVSSSANVYDYTTVIGRPYDITQVRYHFNGGVDRKLEWISRKDYFAIASKDTQSVPLKFMYDVQRTAGNLVFWPVPNSELDYIQFTYKRTLQDMINSADDPDFPQEWLLPLTSWLSIYLMFTYGLKDAVDNRMMQLAANTYQIAKSLNRDAGSIYLQPDPRELR